MLNSSNKDLNSKFFVVSFIYHVFNSEQLFDDIFDFQITAHFFERQKLHFYVF